ncbi:MAG: ActD-like protein [Myxococcota bacterium]
MSPTHDGARAADRGPERVPELLVEKLRLGELAPADADAVRQRLAAEPGGLARLAALDADDAATLARHPRLAAARAEAGGPPRASSPRWLRLAAPAVLAVVAALLLFARADADAPSRGGLRPKGGDVAPRLVIYRQGERRGRARRRRAGQAGTALQVAYIAAGRSYGAIMSVDGRGGTTVHLAAGPLEQGGEGAAAALVRARRRARLRALRADDARAEDARSRSRPSRCGSPIARRRDRRAHRDRGRRGGARGAARRADGAGGPLGGGGRRQ